MAKKKKSIVARRKRRSNPGKTTEFAVRAAAGFAGYAATRFAGRAAYTLALKKFPGASKHLSVLASVASAGGVMFLGDKWDKIAEHKDEIMIGSAIAAIQTLGQAYMPDKFAWLISDHFEGGKFAADQPEQKATSGFAADSLAGILPPEPEPEPTQAALPPAEESFDLDAFMKENNLEESEAVGHAPPVETPKQQAPDGDEWFNSDGAPKFMN